RQAGLARRRGGGIARRPLARRQTLRFRNHVYGRSGAVRTPPVGLELHRSPAGPLVVIPAAQSRVLLSPLPRPRIAAPADPLLLARAHGKAALTPRAGWPVSVEEWRGRNRALLLPAPTGASVVAVRRLRRVGQLRACLFGRPCPQTSSGHLPGSSGQRSDAAVEGPQRRGMRSQISRDTRAASAPGRAEGWCGGVSGARRRRSRERRARPHLLARHRNHFDRGRAAVSGPPG